MLREIIEIPDRVNLAYEGNKDLNLQRLLSVPKFAISSAIVGRADASFTRHGAFVRTAGVVFWEMRPWCVVRTLDGGKQAAAQNKVDT